MPRPVKIRVCTETDKKKAEIFNKIDDLISTGNWSEALEKLNYLFRNAPSLHKHVHRKLAWLYFEMENYRKALAYLQEIIPTNEIIINRMMIICFLKLDMKDQAVFFLAKMPLGQIDKRKLLVLIYPELKTGFFDKKESTCLQQITIRCPKCTNFLFFIEKRFKCLSCDFS